MQLIPVSTASEKAQQGLIDYMTLKWGATYTLPSLLLCFDGCLLPMETFANVPTDQIDEVDEQMKYDISLWLFLRYVGRLPTPNGDTAIHQQEAKMLAEAMLNPDWKQALHNPLERGYLPY